MHGNIFKLWSLEMSLQVGSNWFLITLIQDRGKSAGRKEALSTGTIRVGMLLSWLLGKCETFHYVVPGGSEPRLVNGGVGFGGCRVRGTMKILSVLSDQVKYFPVYGSDPCQACLCL